MTLIATRPTSTTPDGRLLLTTHELALVVRRVASEPQRWRPQVRRSSGSLDVQLSGPVGVEVRLRTWWPAQHDDLHDDGESLSAYAVVEGTLTEVRDDDVLGSWATVLQAPAVRVVERGVVYALRNDHSRPAVTIHAFAPARAGARTAARDLSTTA